MILTVGLFSIPAAQAESIQINTYENVYLANETVFFEGEIFSEKNPDMIHYTVTGPDGHTLEKGNLLVTEFIFGGEFFITPINTQYGTYTINVNEESIDFMVVETLQAKADHKIFIHEKHVPFLEINKGESVRWVTDDTLILVDVSESRVFKIFENILTFENVGKFFYIDRDNSTLRGTIQVN